MPPPTYTHRYTHTHSREHIPCTHTYKDTHTHMHTYTPLREHTHEHTDSGTHTLLCGKYPPHTHTHTVGNTPHTEIYTCTRLDKRSQLTQNGTPAGRSCHPPTPPHTHVAVEKLTANSGEMCLFPHKHPTLCSPQRDPAIRTWGHEQARYDLHSHNDIQMLGWGGPLFTWGHVHNNTRTHTLHTTPPLCGSSALIWSTGHPSQTRPRVASEADVWVPKHFGGLALQNPAPEGGAMGEPGQLRCMCGKGAVPQFPYLYGIESGESSMS